MPDPLLAAKNILVVEDDEACRYLDKLILEDAGFSFSMAVNGQEAVDKAGSAVFDAVLMDLRMPVMDGYDATRQIREMHKDLPVIALTANAMAWEAGECQASGMNDYLIKPFTEEQLIWMLLKWTEQQNTDTII